LLLSFCHGPPDTERVDIILLYPVLYGVLTRKLLVVDIIVAVVVAAAVFRVVKSGFGPRLDQLKRRKQLAANLPSFGLK
jgi:hypothetical protein